MNNGIKKIILDITAGFFKDKAVGAIGSAFAGTLAGSVFGNPYIAIPVCLICHIIYATASNKISEDDAQKISDGIFAIIRKNRKQLDEIRDTQITNLSHILETELKVG